LRQTGPIDRSAGPAAKPITEAAFAPQTTGFLPGKTDFDSLALRLLIPHAVEDRRIVRGVGLRRDGAMASIPASPAPPDRRGQRLGNRAAVPPIAPEFYKCHSPELSDR
jgi:hypothetical protein